jgi:hypothetical protein
MEAALSSAPAPLLFLDDNKKNGQKFCKTENLCYRLPCGRTKPARRRVGWREKWGGGMRVNVFPQPATRAEADGKFFI